MSVLARGVRVIYHRPASIKVREEGWVAGLIKWTFFEQMQMTNWKGGGGGRESESQRVGERERGKEVWGGGNA